MKVFEGCRCPNCQSVMFPTNVNMNEFRMVFVCPRGCCYTIVENIINKIPSEYLGYFLRFFNYSNLPYHNFCWNCHREIDTSLKLKRDPIITLGYICPYCNQSLRGLMTRKNKITQHRVSIPSSPCFVENLL